MLNVAEAVIRVFHARGDYQHKQRNRMKFLIKSMGWEAFRAAFDEALAAVRAEGGRPLTFESEPPRIEAAPDWERLPAPSIDEIARRVDEAALSGPGILPVRRTLPITTTPHSRSGGAPTSARRSSRATSTATVTVPLGDLSGAQFRVLADLAGAYGDGTVRVTAVQNLVFRWVRRDDVARCSDRCRPPASACRMRTRSPT